VGRRRISEADRLFRHDIANQLRAAMKSRELNQTDASRELGITKQALSQYLREKSTPQGDILARVCAKWRITVRYRDTEFTLGALEAVRTRTTPEALQLDLFREPQVLENAHIVVSVARSHKSTLQVTIKMKQVTVPLPSRLAKNAV
jgi:transcriptional regulator with XRE-family HTH domain